MPLAFLVAGTKNVHPANLTTPISAETTDMGGRKKKKTY